FPAAPFRPLLAHLNALMPRDSPSQRACQQRHDDQQRSQAELRAEAEAGHDKRSIGDGERSSNAHGYWRGTRPISTSVPVSVHVRPYWSQRHSSVAASVYTRKMSVTGRAWSLWLIAGSTFSLI